MAATDYAAKVAELWVRVQTNEESLIEKRAILNDCDVLMADSEFTPFTFLVAKLKLIMHKAGKESNLEALAQEFEAEAKKDPTNVDIWICHAETLLHDDKSEQALVSLEFAKTLGDDPNVLCLISLCYRRKKTQDIRKSLAVAKDAIKLDMKNGKSWANLGIAYLTLSGYDNIVQSKKAFAMALKNGQDKNADVLLNFGTVYELLLDFKNALQCYEQSMVITRGWAVAAENVGRLKEKLSRAAKNVTFVENMKKKIKDKLIEKLQEDNEYIIVETPADNTDPAHIVVCLDKNGKIFTFGVTKTLKAYFIPKKTVLKIPTPQFDNIEIDGVTFPYHIIEDQKDVQVIGGCHPTTVAPASVTSSIA